MEGYSPYTIAPFLIKSRLQCNRHSRRALLTQALPRGGAAQGMEQRGRWSYRRPIDRSIPGQGEDRLRHFTLLSAVFPNGHAHGETDTNATITRLETSQLLCNVRNTPNIQLCGHCRVW